MNFLAEEHEIMILCRNSNGLSEDKFHSSINFRYFSRNSLLIKIRDFFKVVLSFKPQIVQVNYLVRDSVVPAIFKPFFNYKIIISIWGSDLNIYAQNKKNRHFQRYGLLNADQILLLSDYFLPRMKSLFPEISLKKMQVLSWGVEYKLFNQYDKKDLNILKKEWGIPFDHKIILSYRNLKPLYNQITLIKAIPEIIKEYPKTTFVIICGNSDQQYLNKIQEMIDFYQVKDHVILKEGWIDRNVIARLLNMSFVSISIPEMDGLPASLLEIMCTRSIPLISNLENYQAFAKDKINAYVLRDIKDSSELATLISHIIKCPLSERKTILKNNRQYILDHQNWDSQLIKIKNLYNQV